MPKLTIPKVEIIDGQANRQRVPSAYGHLHGSGRNGYTLTVYTDLGRVDCIGQFKVLSKAEARHLCLVMNYKPWNF